MKLNERTLQEFVQQAKDVLASEDENILAIHGSMESFAWNSMTKPDGMNWRDFSVCCNAVGNE